MNKQGKEVVLKDLADSFSNAKAAFFADYKGLTVEQINDLRRKLRSHNVKIKVIKNNLARLAVKQLKTSSDSMNQMMDKVVGPTMVAFSYGDAAAAAKAIKKFEDENEAFGLKDSLLGNQLMSSAQVGELAKLPSREVLLAKMLGSMNAPVTNFVGVLAAVPRSFVQVLAAIEQKKKELS